MEFALVRFHTNFVKPFKKFDGCIFRSSHRGAFLGKGNLLQIYRRTPMLKSDFNKVGKATLLKSHFRMGVLL